MPRKMSLLVRYDSPTFPRPDRSHTSNMLSRQQQVFWAGISILLIAVLLGWLVLRRYSLRAYHPQISFSAQAWASKSFLTPETPSLRQLMIRDLVLNVLPGSTRADLEGLLGVSPSHEEMRRHTQADFEVRERNPDGTWKPFPRSGIGHYGEEFDWDSMYVIGYEQRAFNPLLEPGIEELYFRFDTNGVFSSWYISGSKLWPRIVGEKGRRTYRKWDSD